MLHKRLAAVNVGIDLDIAVIEAWKKHKEEEALGFQAAEYAKAGKADVVSRDKGGRILKFATLFSGGELFGVGARLAGLKHSFGVEQCPKIATVAQVNGFNVYCQDVRQFKPPSVDLFLLHASPPCQRASNAHPNSKEDRLDLELALAITSTINQLQPAFFTLENVIGYQKFAAFDHICESLSHLGYSFNYWNVNLADFGVPQTRRRLFLIALRDGYRIQRMSATHKPQADFFAKRWIGWGDALANEIYNLQPSPLSKKQEAKIQKHWKHDTPNDILVDTRNGGLRQYTFRLAHEPSYTITATASKGHGKVRYQDKWYKLSQKAYAMFQTVPGCYKLTGTGAINQRIIGNGVPPHFVKLLCEHLIRMAK